MACKTNLDKTADLATEFAHSVYEGLRDSPRRLDCKFIYDDHGSRIFELICEQPEYYLTRSEESILNRSANEIVRQTGPVNIIEFGSGNSVKTRLLLKAHTERHGGASYIPVDISGAILDQARDDLAKVLPSVDVFPYNGKYEDAFHLFSEASPSMFLFLGSNVGNMSESESEAFWQMTSSSMSAGDYCLLGIDITSDPDELHAAYNDKAGYSADFTKNIFCRMNRELGTNLDIDKIEHVAEYNETDHRIEIFAEFKTAQAIDIAPLNKSLRIPKGARIQTEICRKFHLDKKLLKLEAHGFDTVKVFKEKAKFAVVLLRKF